MFEGAEPIGKASDGTIIDGSGVEVPLLKAVHIQRRLAWDTPGFAIGLSLYDAIPGDYLLAVDTYILAQFNGTTPKVAVYPEDGDAITGYVLNFALDQNPANFYIGSGNDLIANNTSAGFLFGDFSALLCKLDDGAGGDPGSTTGLVIVNAVIVKGV